MGVDKFIQERERLIKKREKKDAFKEVLEVVFLILLLCIVFLINSCVSVPQKPYCKKIIEVPKSEDDFKKNEEILLNCIEDLETLLRHK